MDVIQLENVKTTTEYGGKVYVPHSDFGFFELKAGESIGPGAHKHPEIIYVVQGEVTLMPTKGGEEVTAKQGNIVTVLANEEKTLVNNGSTLVQGFWVNAVSL